MKSGFTKRDLRCENRNYRGTGGLSQENGCCGFSPAFLDTETGIIYRSCFSDGRPAPLHLLDGLSENVVLARGPNGRVTAVKDSIVAGFIQSGRFYTREQAAQQVRRIEPPPRSRTKRPTLPHTNPTFPAAPPHGSFPLETPFRLTAQSCTNMALELGRLTMLSNWSLIYGSPYPRLWEKYCHSGYDLFDCWLDYSLGLLDSNQS